MTKNQIEYQKLKETQRSNQANEALTASRDEVNRQIGFGTLHEQQRANRAKEAQAYAVLGETQRSNLAQEELKRASLDETSRSNQAQEVLKLQQNKISGYQYLEQKRSNQARETETERNNRAVLAESARATDLKDLREAQRIGLTREQLNEQIRNNNLNYDISSQELAERYRHNLAGEIETKRSNEESERITDSNNTTRNLETQRHNKVTEANDQMRTGVYMVSEGFDIGNQFVKTVLTPFGVVNGVVNQGGNNYGKAKGNGKENKQGSSAWSWTKQKLEAGPDFGPNYEYYYYAE